MNLRKCVQVIRSIERFLCDDGKIKSVCKAGQYRYTQHNLVFSDESLSSVC